VKFMVWFKKYRVDRLIIICTVSLLACSALPNIQAEQAHSAISFVDSIGVAVHLSYTDTPYGKYDDIIKPRLQELGVRHIRDGLVLEDLATRDKFEELGKLGIKSTMVMDPRDKNISTRAVNTAKSIPNSIEAVEGANEWDVHPEFKYEGQNFPEGIRKFQNELYSVMKADPATASLPVLSPSLADAWNASKLKDVACDLGNMHSYAGGGIPSLEIDNRWIPQTKIMCNKPIVATECGYHNGVEIEGQHYGVSELAAAKYLLRLFLEYYNRGIQRAFAYELIDAALPDPKAMNFGLLRHDGSPKPSFLAIKNLIYLLQEGDRTYWSSFPIKSLEYELIGDKTNLHHTLLQKQDGKFYLILWQEISSFDNKKRKDLTVKEKLISLKLKTKIQQLNIYQPLNSSQSIEYIKNNLNEQKINFKIPDSPLVIELIPVV
jgi:hypothetical protein